MKGYFLVGGFYNGNWFIGSVTISDDQNSSEVYGKGS